MAPLVVPGICRFAMYGTIGRPWVNILDIHIDVDVGESREEAIVDQAEIINQQWPTKVQAVLSPAWSYQGVRWLDLHSLEGGSGSTSETSGTLVLPVIGLQAGQGSTPGSSILIKKRAGATRGTRHGRMFLCGVSEANTEQMTFSAVSTLNTGLANALTAINQSSAPLSVGSYNSEIVVVHTPKNVPPSYSKVTALEAQSLLATQRRRLRP